MNKSARYLQSADYHVNALAVAQELVALGTFDRGFCVARTFCSDEGFVVWLQSEDGKEGIPFFHATLVGALRQARVYLELGEGWGWKT